MTGKPADSSIVGPGRSDVPTIAGGQGRYRVIRLLGRGTMSSVYLAEQISMARPVALKILSPSLSSDPRFIERFLREARASARLNHPNIVAAFDFGEYESRFFMAMEFVDGEPLSALIEREGGLDEGRVVGIGLQVLAALEHASRHQVVHLDVKPANIMIGKDGRVKLTDFGIALLLDRPEGAEAVRRGVGTPYYMAPEQVEGGKLDWRTDQFSLGASMYEAVTGKKPFEGTNVSEVLVKRFFEKPEPAWRGDKRKATLFFSAVLGKTMSRSPDGRYQSFRELEDDLTRVREGKKPLVAQVSSVSAVSAPSSLSRGTLNRTRVIQRVDRMVWSHWRNWFVYSSVLFLALLVVYAAVYARQLMGPTPPAAFDGTLAERMEAMPPDKSKALREAWTGAMSLVRRAEREPGVVNTRRAIYSLRLIASNRDYKDSAYAGQARRMIGLLEERLEGLEPPLIPGE